MSDRKVDRRDALRMGFALAATGIWVPACGGKTGRVRGDAAAGSGGSGSGSGSGVESAAVVDPSTPYGIPPTRAADQPPAKPAAGAVCAETEDNIEGPYYRRGAPLKSALAEGLPGTVLTVRGRVTGVKDCAPLAGAILDVWHADSSGHYDNDGTLDVPASDYYLRGKVKTDSAGNFELRTIVPGRYLNGRVYRPSHIHVKVRAEGHEPLTTQLYFPDDPYNDVDPFIRQSLIMSVSSEGDRRLASFDFALAATV